MTSSKYKVLLIDETDSKKLQNISLKILPHPKDRLPITFLFDNENLYELQQIYPRKYGSWFTNQRVSSDPGYLVASKFDMAYICLPYLRCAGTKYSPLDQILNPMNEFDRLSFDRVSTWNLNEICDINSEFGEDMILYRYNEKKTLTFLKRRVEATAKKISFKRQERALSESNLCVQNFNLRFQSENITNRQQIRVDLENTKEEDIITAIQFLSDYLDDIMVEKLLLEFNYDCSVLQGKSVSLKRKSDWEAELEIEKQTTAYTSQVGIKQVKTDVPEMAKDIILKKSTSTPALKVLKPIKGTQSITSFFGKNKKKAEDEV